MQQQKAAKMRLIWLFAKHKKQRAKLGERVKDVFRGLSIALFGYKYRINQTC